MQDRSEVLVPFHRPPRKAIAHSAALVLIALTPALALPASAAASGFTARLYAPNHTPKVGGWRITVTANHGSRKLSGTVSYWFLYQGIVVSKQPGGKFTRGVFHNTLIWPKRAVGHTITLKVVVNTRYGTDYLDWWIRVKP